MTAQILRQGLLAGVFCAWSTAFADPIVMTINGEEVSAREYALHMQRGKDPVFAHFKQRYGLDDHSGYWAESEKDEYPLKMLREATEKPLVETKVLQALAKERGLLLDTRYETFLEELRNENQRRERALKANEVIYGPRQYREQVYYKVWMGNLRFRLVESIRQDPRHRIEDEVVEKYYDENREKMQGNTLNEMREKIRNYLAEEAFRRLLASECAAARVVVNEGELRAIVPRLD